MPQLDSSPRRGREQRGAESLATSRRAMRRRIRKACEPCRHRKVKCDGGHPCDVCTGYGYKCVYANGEAIAVQTSSPVVVPSPAVSSQLLVQQPEALQAHSNEGDEPRSRLYVLSEGTQAQRSGSTRFTRVDSAIAFPRSIGLSLQASEPPRLQAFAWNTGTREERLETAPTDLLQYVTRQDVEIFFNQYLISVHPIFEIIDRDEFDRRVTRYYSTRTFDAGFEVILCGVLALGSLFSPRGSYIYEADVVEHGRSILDRTIASSAALLSLDFVIGWALRAIYLRSTSTPHTAWIASSMAMHIAESIGLHQEMSDIKKLSRTTDQESHMSEVEIENRRKTFWVASSFNRLLSAQCGRTMTALQNVGCRYPETSGGNAGDSFVEIMRLLPHLCDPGSLSSISILISGLLELGKISISKLPLILLRADMVFCVFRKLIYIGITLSNTQTETILSVIRTALDAADSLILEAQQWWTIIGIPFQSICVLIALNTMESLQLLSKAMETLQNVATTFNSPTSREALRTAHHLVKVAEKKRRSELESLQKCVNLNAGINNTPNPAPEESTACPVYEWPTDMDLGFSEFFNTWSNEELGLTGSIAGPSTLLQRI